MKKDSNYQIKSDRKGPKGPPPRRIDEHPTKITTGEDKDWKIQSNELEKLVQNTGNRRIRSTTKSLKHTKKEGLEEIKIQVNDPKEKPTGPDIRKLTERPIEIDNEHKK